MSESETIVTCIALLYCKGSLLFCFTNYHIFINFPVHYCNFLFLVEVMGDEIQPVTVVPGTDVATDAEVHNDKDDEGEHTVDLESKTWMVGQYMADYLTAFDETRYSAMFPDERNQKMFSWE